MTSGTGTSGIEPVTAPGIHDATAAPAVLVPPFTPQQLLQMGADFVEGLLRAVVKAVLGVFSLDIPAFDQLSAWADQLASDVGSLFGQVGQLVDDLLHNTIAVLGSIPQALVTGLTGALTIVTGTIGGVIDGIVNGFLGLFGSNWGVADAQSAAAAIAEQQAATAAGVAALQQQSNTAAQSGASAFVDFSTKADATSLGADFAQFYSGSGTSTWGIVSGRVSVVGAAAAGRVARAVYTALGTLTDYQRVSAVFSSSQMVTSFGFLSASVIYGFNYIDGRSDATGANCVRVIFGNGSLWFGAVIAGVWTQWTTQGHAFKPGAIYSLECGTSGGIRQYKVLCNSVPILVWTEVGTASLLGASYRKSGLGAEWQVGYDGGGGVFYAGPGNVAAFAIADSTIPTLIGSIGRAFRAAGTSGLAGAVSTNYFPVPNGLFDTVDYASSDLTFSTTTGTWTVTKRGNYLVSTEMQCDVTNQSGVIGVMVNGILRASGGSGVSAAGAFLIALSPGDSVQIAFRAYTALNIVGTAAGNATWFQIARVTEDVVL